jgi:hypothetical protein
MCINCWNVASTFGRCIKCWNWAGDWPPWIQIWTSDTMLIFVLWGANEDTSDSVDSFICSLKYVLFTGMGYGQ